MDPIAFQRKWIGSTLKERSASQSHFNDLCAVLGVPTPPILTRPASSISRPSQASLVRLRRNWLDPEGATEAELKKRTLTSLYNQRPTWLQNAHALLDRAVWAAYGWDDPDPSVVAEDTILSRLLALNLERASCVP